MTDTQNTSADEAVIETAPVEMAEMPVEDSSTLSEAPTEVVAEPAEEAPVLGKWYVVHTQSGFEAKAKDGLEQRTKTLGFSDRIFEVIVPMQNTVVISKGQKKNKKEKVFPGYILVRMILDNDSWIVVRTTQGITGFVGAGAKPTPISDKEVQAIMKWVNQDQPKFKTKFSTGEVVKLTHEPFTDFIGTISSMDEDKGKVTVLVTIFGRETPVELDFLQVAKL